MTKIDYKIVKGTKFRYIGCMGYLKQYNFVNVSSEVRKSTISQDTIRESLGLPKDSKLEKWMKSLK